MSMNTQIRIQNRITNRKTSKIVQNTASRGQESEQKEATDMAVCLVPSNAVNHHVHARAC